jgi:hypothetical protein
VERGKRSAFRVAERWSKSRSKRQEAEDERADWKRVAAQVICEVEGIDRLDEVFGKVVGGYR